MNSNSTDEIEKLVKYKISHLLEFYNKETLLRFFQECDEHELDIPDAFVCLDSVLRTALGDEGLIPAFKDLVDRCAETNSWSFAGTRRGFHSSCR